MSKLDKLRARFWANPKPADFSWRDLVKLMSSYGYHEIQGSGSRVKFFNPSIPGQIHIHRRHPDPTLLEYQLDAVRDGLRNAGFNE